MSSFLKKKFGQNFLIDKNIQNKIINLIPSENLSILEIGPGDGKLTDKIITKKPSKLTLVEIDKDLIKNLLDKYSNIKKIELVNKNILDFEFKRKYELVISNLPYNISSQILVKLSTMNIIPDKLILMFQKEFGQRLLDKKLNSINSLICCFYDIKLNFHVSKNSFYPIPKIDSSVLTFKKKVRKLIRKDEINNYILFKRKLFSHKRKSLKKNLKNYNFKEEFNLDLRVENLELNQLVSLFRSSSS
tara:strand:- start:1547 stop:2284 length:738 start_codon:yes stop_codon:yes gene_type:complete